MRYCRIARHANALRELRRVLPVLPREHVVPAAVACTSWHGLVIGCSSPRSSRVTRGGSPLRLLCGYGFAWIGHFFFEHNRPATFTHPLYSLIGDWVMFRDMLTGRIRW